MLWAMRTIIGGCLLVLTFLSGNPWLFDLCRSQLSELPECCRNGFCPHHHHAPVRDSNTSDCTCQSRDPELVTIVMSAPAIVVPAISISRVLEVTVLDELFKTEPLSFDCTPPTPPPKIESKA